MGLDLSLSLSLGSARGGGSLGSHGLTVGFAAGSYGFVSATTGAIDPPDIGGTAFTRLTAVSSNLVQVQPRFGTTTTLRLSFPGFSATPLILTWNAGNSAYEATVAGFFTFLQNNENNTIPFTPTPASAPSAFTAPMWTLATGSGPAELDVTILSLPSGNGGTITDVEADVDASGTFASLGITSGTVTLPMALPNTDYAIRLRAVNFAGAGTPGDSKTETSGALPAPLLTNPIDAANGANASTGAVDTNDAPGDLYAIVSTSTTKPSSAQIKLGQDHTGTAAPWSGNQLVTATGTQTLSPAPSGLTAETQYYTHFLHEHPLGGDSLVATASGFTTGAVVSTNVGFQAAQDEGTSFDLYVDNVNGNDGNSGTSVGAAKATIGGAIAVHSANQTIGIRNVDGTVYNEALAVPSNITLSGYAAEKPVLSGSQLFTGAVACVAGDETVVGPNWASMYKITGVAKTNFVDDDPFNAHLIEDGTQMMIAMGRLPNPRFRNIESFNLDWLWADEVVTDGGTPELILGHKLPSFTDNYTKAQIENCDVRFHRAPNGATRTPVASFDEATKTIFLTDQTREYETNQYRNRFALVNLVPAIQVGQWAFVDQGTTADIYFWPRVPANVNTKITYSNLDTLISGRDSENVVIRSMIIRDTAATQPVGFDVPIRFDRGLSNPRIGPFTIDNCWIKNSYSKGDGYGAIYARNHDNYLIRQTTIEDIRNAFGLFLSGGRRGDVSLQTEGGKMERSIVLRADKSPIRIYANKDNIVDTCWFLDSGLAAHANKGNHYWGGIKSLWIRCIWHGCSGYWTWQHTDRQDLVLCWVPTNFSDARAIVDQNNVAYLSDATFNNTNGDTYILNNESPATQNAVDAASFNAMILGEAVETNVLFSAQNNIIHGDTGTLADKLITNGWKNNTYTGGTTRDPSDVSTPHANVYEDVSVGNFGVKATSPTRSAAGNSLASLPGTDGAITLTARWPGVDFTKDAAGDPWDLANPGVGCAGNPDNLPALPPSWIERPVITGTPTVGTELSVSAGICMQIKNYQAPTHQWCRVSDPYSDSSLWTEIAGATGSTYTAQGADVGFYLGVKSAVGVAETQVVMNSQVQSSFPISMGNVLVSTPHIDDQNIPINTWWESATFVSDGTPLLVMFVCRTDTSTVVPTWEVTVGAQGRANGTGEAVTMDAAAYCQRGNSMMHFGAIIAPTAGTVTIQWRSTDQIIDSIAPYVYPVTGMTAFGVKGSRIGGSNRTSLAPDVDTGTANSLVVHAVVRQALTTAPTGVTSNVGTMKLQNGYSGQLQNAGSALADFAVQEAAGVGNYAATLSWTTARSAGAISIELLS